MRKVGIFQIGYSKVDISKLCHLMNVAGNHYHFERATRVSNLGSPDTVGYAYSDRAFITLVYPYLDDYDIGVIITSVPIDDNFFTRNVGNKLIICTSHQGEEIIERSGRSAEECAALAICEELVSIEFQRVTGEHWSKLFHDDPRGCLFDFAGIKSQTLAKITSCSICIDCEGKLSRSNIHEDVVGFVKFLLTRIRRPSITKALRISVTSPILSFVYGGIVIGAVVNIFSSLIISSSTPTQQQLVVIWLLAAFIPLFPFLVYGWLWLDYIRVRLS